MYAHIRDARPCMRCMFRYEMHRCGGEGGGAVVHSWGRCMVVARWYDGGQNGNGRKPRWRGTCDRTRHERPRGRRRDWPDRVIGGSPRCRNRVMGRLGEGSATALRSLRSRRGWITNFTPSNDFRRGHYRLVYLLGITDDEFDPKYLSLRCPGRQISRNSSPGAASWPIQ